MRPLLTLFGRCVNALQANAIMSNKLIFRLLCLSYKLDAPVGDRPRRNRRRQTILADPGDDGIIVLLGQGSQGASNPRPDSPSVLTFTTPPEI